MTLDYTRCHIGVRSYTVGFLSDMTSSTELFVLSEYWAHCEFYPRCITLSDDLFDELSGILMHLILSTSLFCREEAR